jgi:hypothetical protein
MGARRGHKFQKLKFVYWTEAVLLNPRLFKGASGAKKGCKAKNGLTILVLCCIVIGGIIAGFSFARKAKEQMG